MFEVPSRRRSSGQSSGQASGQSRMVGRSSANDARGSEAGAGVQGGRVFGQALGWALALAFLWEVVGRPILAALFPEAGLPPSAMTEIRALLMGLLGLGL